MKLALASLLAVVALPALAQTPSSDDEKGFYALGFNIGQNMKGSFAPTDDELHSLAKGLGDGATGAKAAINVEELGGPQKVTALQQARHQHIVDDNKAKGKAYAEAAAKEAGAQTLPSGVVYVEQTAGTGDSPKATDRVKVNYRGSLIDGAEFDSSYKRGQPAEFPLNGVVKCWTEGLQKMKVGGKAKLVCPSDVAYGERGQGARIPGGSTLVFEVELLAATAPPPPPAPMAGLGGKPDAGSKGGFGKGCGCTAAGAVPALWAWVALGLSRRRRARRTRKENAMRVFAVLALGLLVALPAFGQEPKTDDEKTLYSLGYNIGQNVKGSFMPSKAEVELIKKGLSDAVTGQKPLVSTEEAPQKISALQQKRHQAVIDDQKKRGGEFFTKAAKEKGAQKLPSGILYIEQKAGKGDGPKPTDRVSVNYRGTLIDGTEFDSSYKRGKPSEFGLNGVVKCWTEGLQKMKPGGKGKLVCPPEAGYGERGSGKIPGGATLVFEVELISVSAPPPQPAAPQMPQLPHLIPGGPGAPGMPGQGPGGPPPPHPMPNGPGAPGFGPGGPPPPPQPQAPPPPPK